MRAQNLMKMVRLLFGFLGSWFRSQSNLALENVSLNSTALWVVQQLCEAFPFDTAPRYLIFDRDSTFSTHVVATTKSFGIKPVRTSWHSPWQNGVVERWIGSCRRELLETTSSSSTSVMPQGCC
jgi:hypothetical protein